MSDTTTDAPALEAGQLVTYAGRVGIVVAVVREQADGSPWLKPHPEHPGSVDKAEPEVAYRVAWFESTSDPIPESVLAAPHPSEL